MHSASFKIYTAIVIQEDGFSASNHRRGVDGRLKDIERCRRGKSISLTSTSIEQNG